MPVGRVPIVGTVAAGRTHPGSGVHRGLPDLRHQRTGGGVFCLAGAGESMLNAGILPGDLVVVHQQPEAHNGEIVVALLGEEATVKRLSRRNGQVWAPAGERRIQPHRRP